MNANTKSAEELLRAPFRTVVEIIGPERAAELLKTKNTRNRPMNLAKVQQFIRDIESDQWQTTHQTIGIAPSFIVDGQHRLQAVATSGHPIMFNVTYYETDAAAEAALPATDITDKRSGGDMFEIERLTERGKGHEHERIARAFCRFGFASVIPAQRRATHAEVRRVYASLKDEIEWVTRTLVSEDLGGLKTRSPRFLLAHKTAFIAAHILDAEKIERFANAVVKTDASLFSENRDLVLYWNLLQQEGKMALGKQQRDKRMAEFVPLKILQLVLTNQGRPGLLRYTASTAQWFRDQLDRKRKSDAPVVLFQVNDDADDESE